MRARVYDLPGVPSYLHLRPNRARTPDVAAVVARSMAAAPRVPLRIEFARVRARALWTPAASPLCSAAPHASLPRLKQKPLDACDRVVLGWDSAFARCAAHDPPGSRRDACSCKTLNPKTLNPKPQAIGLLCALLRLGFDGLGSGHDHIPP